MDRRQAGRTTLHPPTIQEQDKENYYFSEAVACGQRIIQFHL